MAAAATVAATAAAIATAAATTTAATPLPAAEFLFLERKRNRKRAFMRSEGPEIIRAEATATENGG